MTNEFKPGDIVRLKGGVDEFRIEQLLTTYNVLCSLKGTYFNISVDVLELIQRTEFYRPKAKRSRGRR